MITRSYGYSTGYMGLMAGGGYEGSTKELDDTVKKQAELLSQAFGRSVEIRFNSDRNSGGAWLANSLEGFSGNCQVGFNAGLYPVRPDNMTNDEYYKQWETLPKKLRINTYVYQSALKDASLAKDGYREPVCDTVHASVEDGIAWLTNNIDKGKLYN